MADLQRFRAARIIGGMPGNAEGARKARERRSAKVAARQVARLADAAVPARAGAGSPDQPYALTDALRDALPVSEDQNGSTDGAAVTLARQALTNLVPSAVITLGKMIQGRIKVPGNTRANVAVRVLEMAGVPVDHRRPGGGAVEGNAARLLEALERVAAFRRAAAGAETVEPVATVGAPPSQD